MRKALLIVGLMLCLSGCATPSAPSIVRVLPPAALAETCQEPIPALQTNGELVSYVLALKSALSGCAAQVDALRAWMQSDPQAHGQN